MVYKVTRHTSKMSYRRHGKRATRQKSPSRTKTKISNLKVTLERLKEELSHGSGWTKEQELMINKLGAEQKDYEEQLEEKVNVS